MNDGDLHKNAMLIVHHIYCPMWRDKYTKGMQMGICKPTMPHCTCHLSQFPFCQSIFIFIATKIVFIHANLQFKGSSWFNPLHYECQYFDDQQTWQPLVSPSNGSFHPFKNFSQILWLVGQLCDGLDFQNYFD